MSGKITKREASAWGDTIHREKLLRTTVYGANFIAICYDWACQKTKHF